MVKLGKGQAIIGGRKTNGNSESKIYLITCSNRNCHFSLLDKELSVPRQGLVAIPIPDTISECITGGSYNFKKISKALSNQLLFSPTLKYSMPVPTTDWGWLLS